MMSTPLRRIGPNPPTSKCPHSTYSCLPSYNAIRRLFGLNRVQNFKELVSNSDISYKRLEELYGNIDKMDFYIGGLLEPTEKCTTYFGSEEIGETFAAVVREHFIDSRHPRYAGDRFWDGWLSEIDAFEAGQWRRQLREVPEDNIVVAKVQPCDLADPKARD